MNKRKVIIIILLFTILTALTIFIADYISRQSTTPDTTHAITWTAFRCSGDCESGAECNTNGDPPPGLMWICDDPDNDQTNYFCGFDDINANGNQCYLKCGNNPPYDNYYQPCGCDVDLCVNICLSSIQPGQSGTYTMTCGEGTDDGCGQKFTCSCSKPLSFTDTPPPTTTVPATTTVPPTTTVPVTTTIPPTTSVPPTTTIPVTTSVPPTTTVPVTTVVPPTTTVPVTTSVPPTTIVITTPPITPSGTLITPTLPRTALVSDKADRLIIGILLVMVGLTIYTLGLHESIGEFLWKYINVPVMPFLKKKQSEEIIVSGINQSYKKKFKKTDKK